jgi:predicted nucleic acid-binding Zn ribbon protein
MRAVAFAGFIQGRTDAGCIGPPISCEPLCEPSMQLCEHSVLRQLRDERRLSFANDNCQRNSARVNSTSLYKGITVERRRRKASGPARARAQDSGVAGGDFITKRLSSPSAVYSCCASSFGVCVVAL